MTTALPLVVAITGASGAPYSVRLLQALAAAGQPSWLIVSEHGLRLLQTESGVGDLKALRDRVGAAGLCHRASGRCAPVCRLKVFKAVHDLRPTGRDLEEKLPGLFVSGFASPQPRIRFVCSRFAHLSDGRP